MKRKQVYRYYCDFCKKNSGTKTSMQLHEAHCTMNPNRTCRMCNDTDYQQLANIVQYLIQEKNKFKQLSEDAFLFSPFDTKTADNILKKITFMASECPVCILAAIRQSGLNSYDLNFDYKKTALSFLHKYPNMARDFS